MAGPSENRQIPRARSHAAAAHWALLARRAAARLETRVLATGAMWPRDVARVVAAALPRRLGGWLLAELERLGWLREDAAIPFDVLDGARCPPAFRGGCRAVVRLAVFGLPGQGLSSRDKHREVVYQQLCAEIMRTAVDTVSLQAIANRAMNHPDALADPLLSSMLRSFIAQREAALRVDRVTPAEQHAAREQASKLRQPFDQRHDEHFPTRSELQASFARMQGQFDAAVAQFEERLAAQMLRKMRELRRRFPVHIPSVELQHCEEQYDRFLKRAGTYRRQIQDLAAQASEAARKGDEKSAEWIARRLQAIHTLLPTLLPASRLEELRSRITLSEQARDSEDATREFLQREREVAVEIKSLAGVIHQFHELASRVPANDERLQRAREHYSRAVERIRELDTDWLAGLILQLETLLDDLDDPGGEMHGQLDQFIVKVRTALNRLRLEIRSIQAGRARPADGQAPPQSA